MITWAKARCAAIAPPPKEKAGAYHQRGSAPDERDNPGSGVGAPAQARTRCADLLYSGPCPLAQAERRGRISDLPNFSDLAFNQTEQEDVFDLVVAATAPLGGAGEMRRYEPVFGNRVVDREGAGSGLERLPTRPTEPRDAVPTAEGPRKTELGGR
jgi:hypothetical protein